MPFKFDIVAEPYAGDTLFADPTPDDYAARLRLMGKRVLTRGGGRYQAECPSHEDREPSLSISPGRSKPLVLYCHGCRAGFADLLAAAGFSSNNRSSVSNGMKTGSSDGDGDGYRDGGHFPRNTGDSGHSPVKKFEEGDEPLFERIRVYRRGEESPEFDVRLPLDRVPRNAATLRSAAEWVSVIMGFRLADGEVDAAPISASLLAWAMGLDPVRGKRQASKWLHALERHRVIRQDGEIPMPGKGNGIRCFQPFDRDLAAEFELEAALGDLDLDVPDYAPLGA